VVISDCRFPNEIKSIRDAGGIIVWVKRGALPEWYEWALNANRGETGNMSWATSKHNLEKARIHASETAWVGTKFDHELDNDSTIDELYSKIRNLVQDPPDANERPLYVGLSDSLHIQS